MPDVPPEQPDQAAIEAAVDFARYGIPFDPADRSKGLRHPKYGGEECPYLAPARGSCNKCGWIDQAFCDDLAGGPGA